VLRHVRDDAIDSGMKVGGGGHCLVVRDAVAIERGVGRPAAKRIAHHGIGDSLALQTLL
jgi:hypothetical protein